MESHIDTVCIIPSYLNLVYSLVFIMPSVDYPTIVHEDDRLYNIIIVSCMIRYDI